VPSYYLKNVDDSLWQQFKHRAAKEGHPLRWVLLEMIKRYIKEGLKR
jgi:hypothetical protein